MTRYLTIAGAASYTTLSARTLRRAIAAGELVAHRVGRRAVLSVEDLDRWIAGHRIGASR